MADSVIKGFSKFSREEKLDWLRDRIGFSEATVQLLDRHLHPDPELQAIYGEISENTISNYPLPLGIAPNFLINGRMRALPMVTEESSVVAAASKAARFWAMHGGFEASVVDTRKTGQVHFTWNGAEEALHSLFKGNRERLLEAVRHLTGSMEKRGGGLSDLTIRRTSPELPHSYQLFAIFQTADAMGANFINSVLEALAAAWESVVKASGSSGSFQVIMSILSNYTPECRVECQVEGRSADFDGLDAILTGKEVAARFVKAVEIAGVDPYRAVTHNKGIFNGMDAVIIATGNDFRAVEACGHAYAARNGPYASLSSAELSGDRFRFSLDVPLAVGTIGGLTGIHPLAAASLEILEHPSAGELMEIVAAAGLATNFSAVLALVTTGIQQGHMKMHLVNILRQLGASPDETEALRSFFTDRNVSYSEVKARLHAYRDQKPSP